MRLIGGKVYKKACGEHALAVQLTHLEITLRYFRRFPLKTKKRVSLIKFIAIRALTLKSIASKSPMTPNQLLVVRRKAAEINKITGVVEDKVRPTK